MNVPVGVDVQISLTLSLVTTAINEHNPNQVDNILRHGYEVLIFDAGYQCDERHEELSQASTNLLVANAPARRIHLKNWWWNLLNIKLSALVILSMSPFLSYAGGGSRIVNGYDTNLSFGFLTYIEIDGNSRCGGVFIDEGHILTAAHCVTEKFSKNVPIDVSRLKVYFGGNKISVMKSNANLTRGVASIITHNNYDNRFGSNYPNDIAILQLTSPVSSAIKARLIEVKEQQDLFDSNLTSSLVLEKTSYNLANPNLIAIGWGRRSDNSLPDSLNQTFLLSVSTERCRSNYPSDVPQNNGFFCSDTFYTGDVTDTCTGDSGSPILWNSDGVTYIVGLVSYGNNKCNSTLSVYTKIDYYFDFIKSNSNYLASSIDKSSNYNIPRFYVEESDASSTNTHVSFYNGAWTTVTGTINYTYNGKRVTLSQEGWWLGYTNFNIPKGSKDVVFKLSRGNILFFEKGYSVDTLESRGFVGVSAYGTSTHTWGVEDF